MRWNIWYIVGVRQGRRETERMVQAGGKTGVT